jgi:hypothetical protein
MSNCKDCNGRGFIYLDGGETTRACPCRLIIGARRCLERHGLEVGPDSQERTGLLKNGRPLEGGWIITSEWDWFRTHLAVWLMRSYLRDPAVSIKTMTDTELRDLWFGGGGGAKAPSQLASLKNFDLVVVQLRAIENKATPQALYEAIDAAKQVWLVERPSMPFQEKPMKHPNWTPELAGLLVEKGFKRFDLKGPNLAVDFDSIAREEWDA